MDKCGNKECEWHKQPCMGLEEGETCSRFKPLITQKAPVAEVPYSDGLCAKCQEGKERDIKFLVEMSETLKEGRHRKDSVRLDHVQTMIDDWYDELTSA